MRIKENQLRALSRRIMKELFTKSSDFSVKHALGQSADELQVGYGGLYDDGGFYGEGDEEDVDQESELNEDEEGME